ncbi:shikimate kinase [Kordiimonas aestuarii]|uniref:shikimate kinase n=1 Tax=Kordiimonas aestuarii TaxID=1005925 RepID=UPI0021D05B99|nr:shikimate kinase [Kordiimonas aestuarii]
MAQKTVNRASAPPKKQPANTGPERTIVLVGLMGAGKTTVGRRLAKKLGLPFVDSDHEIEKAASMSVAEIFECFGEDDFRSGERRVIDRLLDGKPQVVATGGGAFINAETRALIKEKGTSIWLDADIDVLVERTARRDTRPLLKTGDPREILGRLAAERAPFYAEADLRIASSDGPHEDVVERIVKAVHALGRSRA